jgi:ABC-type transporter Mla subunit MlaD
MNSDLVTKALDQAKALQKTLGDAIAKGAEQAHPLIEDALTKANTLGETLTHSVADASEQAKPHLEGALTHLNGFISAGRDALAAGVAKAHEQLEPLAEQVRQTIDSTAAAMAKKPADAAHPAPDAESKSAP